MIDVHITGLPAELPLMMASHPDTDTARSFRQTCKTLAAVRYWEIGNRISTHINADTANTTVITDLVLGSLRVMPNAAARVTSLALKDHTRVAPHPDSIDLIFLHWSSLSHLVLDGLYFKPAVLYKLLRTHKSTLRTLALVDIALDVGTSGADNRGKKWLWAGVLSYIREEMTLDALSLLELSWGGREQDPGRRSPRYLKLKTRTFVVSEPGCLDAQPWEQRGPFSKIFREGMLANSRGHVACGLDVFIEKTTASAPKCATCTHPDRWHVLMRERNRRM